MKQPLKQTMILFSLAESCILGGKEKKKRRKKRGERKQPQLLFWQGHEMQWWGAESGASCQHIHMSSLFRHTLENVTSFQAWPGKGSTELPPTACTPAYVCS